MSAGAICVVGSLNADLIAYVDSTSGGASYAIGANFEMCAGGKSLNAALSVASLDPSVTLVGRVGSDDLGRFLTSTLEARGVSTAAITRDPAAHTGVGHVRVNPQGDYDTVVIAGANDHLSASDIDSYLEAARTPAFVIMNLEVPLDTVRHAVERFRERGSTIVLNLSPVHERAREFLPLADTVVLNADEARHILEMPEEGDPVTLLHALQAVGGGTVVLTLGAAGAAAIGQDGVVLRVAGQSTQVVNSVGAGDSFLAALVLGLAAGLALERCLDVANAAGALVCGRSQSFLTPEDIPIIEHAVGVPLSGEISPHTTAEATHG
ncbi:ribokinase [Marisediminicola sp. UYEF4]|uniref:PfkB family carbohydrate kinase n=1 Tax=Marisediminicola sp. UYEF4 TaxID=1756384 RepID=UPI00339B1771